MPKTLKPNIGFNEETRSGVTKILNNHLSDLHVLYIKTRNYHWNVRGIHFASLHLLLEKQYTDIAEAIDAVAERTRSIGGNPFGSMKEFLDTAKLKEERPGHIPPAEEMIANLVSDHEAIIRQLREDVDVTAEECHDTGTSDFLTALLEAHEKMAWMLRSLLEA
jgi:starvation-inducible DNA-binding protein